MSGCQGGTYSVDIAAPDLTLRSGVFEAVVASIGALDIADVRFAMPELAKTNLNVDVGNSVKGELEKPYTTAFLPAPTLTASDVSLEAAAYNAVVSLVDFTHNSPVLPSIQYGEGVGHLAVPDSQPSPAPLDYPTNELIDLPAAPVIDSPAAPVLAYGVRPKLTPIDMREYAVVPLVPLEFDSGAMALPDMPDIETMEWPEYEPYTDDAELIYRVKAIALGGDELARWIGGVVQGLLHTSDMRRKALLAKREMDKVYADAASRNYALPAGVVDARIMAIADEEMEMGYVTAQTVKKEIYDAAMATLVVAIKSSIDIERYHFAHYLGFAKRLLAAYKLNLELGKVAYNYVVEIYNAQVQLVSAQVSAYDDYIQTQQGQARTAAMATELTSAQVTTLESLIRMYGADVDTLKASARASRVSVEYQTLPLDVYEASLRGTLANFDVVKQNIASFKQAIENYSLSTDWVTDKISAYESAVQAETSKLGVSEANVRAYKELWSGERERMSAYRSYIDDSFRVADAELNNFKAASSAQQGYLGYIAQVLGDSLSVIDSYRSLASQEASTVRAYNAANTSYTEAVDRSNMVDAQLKMTQQILDETAKAETARITAAQEGIRVRAAGALAQAASSIKQVSFSASGSVSESVSGSVRAGTQLEASKRQSFSRNCIEKSTAAKG